MAPPFHVKVYHIVVIMSIIVVVFGLANAKNSKPISATTHPAPWYNATIGGIKLKLDIADTEAAREQGLSGRPSMPENAGMLFVFAKSGRYPFWMKDMRFDLDFVYLNASFTIVEIIPNVPKESYPRLYMPNKPVRYVLELNAGASARAKLKIGDLLILR